MKLSKNFVKDYVDIDVDKNTCRRYDISSEMNMILPKN